MGKCILGMKTKKHVYFTHDVCLVSKYMQFVVNWADS